MAAKRSFSCLTVVVGLALLTGIAQADTTFSFYNITSNSAVDAAIGEAQLFVDVSAVGTNQALFTFYNTGPAASSITDVYFDDGTLLGIASIDDSDPGVSFSQGASPGNLPGGNALSPPFETHDDFLADSDPAAQPNGVNPGESLGITFNLISGQDISHVLAALGDGTLRIGIHVQGFDGGGSESFVNRPDPVPAPASVSMGVIGLGMVWMARRRLSFLTS